METNVIGADFIKTVQGSAAVLVRAAAEINNQVRNIERECSHADDKVIKSALNRLNSISGNLSEIWEELDLTLASYDLTDTP